ncbi:hypothetical protein HYW54_04535 [Candidatus Gottesmanbacteria bacterium]|nr:hypothetical protein [Candidatus Gottesmanbacteria bacterium]
MGDFNPNFRSGGGRSGGFRGRNLGGRGFERREEGPRMMHKAVCANCGRVCEVPFRPSGDRPVYCSDCFEKRSNEGARFQFQDRRWGERPGGDRGGGQRSNTQLTQELRNLNAKLDRILRVLEPQTPKGPESIITEPKAKKPKDTKKKTTEEKTKE